MKEVEEAAKGEDCGGAMNIGEAITCLLFNMEDVAKTKSYEHKRNFTKNKRNKAKGLIWVYD
ncbi:MAG TPA: hypothetical protein EYO58_12300 [Flavobacteriales bacterium]|nr:hypothetical protein [Flavobacteriales bacterium]